MRIEKSKNLTGAQKEIITRLWNAEYPGQLNFGAVEDFEAFLDKQTGRRHFLLFDENEEIKGWLMTFTRSGERWFSVIIVTGEQKKGYGTALLNEVKSHENEINGWVVAHDDYLKASGEKYRSPLEFYRKNGFAVLENEIFENNGLSAVKIKWTK